LKGEKEQRRKREASDWIGIQNTSPGIREKVSFAVRLATAIAVALAKVAIFPAHVSPHGKK